MTLNKLVAIFLTLLFFYSPSIASAEDEGLSALNKYLVPAEISRLDWALLEAAVYSKDKKWDELGLIESVVMHSDRSKPAIVMAFKVDSGKYFKVTPNMLENVFSNAVKKTFLTIRNRLPDVVLEKDIIATFTIIDEEPVTVAEFINGKITLYKDIKKKPFKPDSSPAIDRNM